LALVDRYIALQLDFNGSCRNAELQQAERRGIVH
jgi:hypothetical protein